MRRFEVTTCLALVVFLHSTGLRAQEAESPSGEPVLKFFFFDERETEWVVSTERDRFEQHLEQNDESAQLYQSLQAAAQPRSDSQAVRATMSRWIEAERERIRQAGVGAGTRIRVAEGVTAYMRAYDFEVSQLIAALLRRSGASEVQVAAVHLLDETGNASYKLKVMLPGDQIGIDRQGINVVLSSPTVGDGSLVYALALALYEVHELLESQSTGQPPPGREAEPLPPPEPDATLDEATPRLELPTSNPPRILQ